jgi:hypothetical protein
MGDFGAKINALMMHLWRTYVHFLLLNFGIAKALVLDGLTKRVYFKYAQMSVILCKIGPKNFG